LCGRNAEPPPTMDPHQKPRVNREGKNLERLEVKEDL
jgi:hypothetical protein